MMTYYVEGVWQQFFTEKPAVLTREEKREWIAKNNNVALGSDAFSHLETILSATHKSGVQYIAQAGGSIRDDNVIELVTNMVLQWLSLA